MTDNAPFAFADIWQPAEDGDRMAFLTCGPNELVGAIYPKAMPVILGADERVRIVEDERTAWLL